MCFRSDQCACETHERVHAVYNNWYNEVYMPTAAQEDSGEEPGGGENGNDENAGG